MTDERDCNDDKQLSDQPQQEDASRQDEANRIEDEWVNPTRKDWKQLASNPNLVTDFGYELEEWNQFNTADQSDTLIFLPSNEDEMHKDAFVVVPEKTVVDLQKQY